MKHVSIAIVFMFLSCDRQSTDQSREKAARNLVADVGPLISMKCAHAGGCGNERLMVYEVCL